MRYYFCLIFFIYFGIGMNGQEDSTTLAISRFDKVPSNIKVHKTIIDNKNVIWLCTNDGLLETTGDGGKLFSYLKGNSIVDFVKDKSEQKWAASVNTIYNINTGKNYELPKPEAIISDIEYYLGEIWVASDKGVFVLGTGSGKFSSYNVTNSKLESDIINFVHADKKKILWVGTQNGYIRVDNGRWKLEEKNRQILATCENNEGQWFITDKDMFLINPYNRLFPVKLEENQYKGKINEFVIDSKGRIYIASDILVRYDPYQEKIEQFADDAAMLSKSALSLACDKNDNIWIGTGGAGFYKLLFGDIAAEQLNVSILLERAVSCLNTSDAQLKASVSGGTKPYSFQWSSQNSHLATLSNLPPGEFSVTVTDKYMTTATASIIIENPFPIEIDIIENKRVTSPVTADGGAKVKAAGGTGQLKYMWSNGTKGPSLQKVNSGIYTVTVQDSKGCMATLDVEIYKEKFIPELEISQLTVGQTLRINELNFEADSSRITPSNYEVLQEVFTFLANHENVRVEIGGHTNTIPPHEYCDKLSGDRARNVAEYLISAGISSSRIKYKGYGKRQPLTQSETAQARVKNQRVEIKILEM
ncbi:MAG: OmpA family protein [Saprospiraceae bacterium]|nr:OmpA family protein [Saprospiraceae bacterium]MBK8855544.1 OmpA family protein [Saprospiraceae bacterium]MBK9043606.1 OmpA family protein [Saprospiraceae bacterium]